MNIATNNEDLCRLALNSLEQVYDPEIGLNIVDLGLLYEILFDEKEKNIICRMTLTTQFCPMGESITDGVYQSLTSVFSEYDVKIHLFV